ncbi:hypothetical protein PC120_g19729 [Phytophthora cactorum]|nr:hypothetical protein PC120_g19729 [Phytophthora cactorum]
MTMTSGFAQFVRTRNPGVHPLMRIVAMDLSLERTLELLQSRERSVMMDNTAGDTGVDHQWIKLEKSEMVNFAKSNDNMADMRASGWTLDPDNFASEQRYPGLYCGEYGPTEVVLSLAESPLKLFFFFMPKSFWRNVATETDRYFVQNLTSRVDRMINNQKTPGKKSKSGFYIAKPESLI